MVDAVDVVESAVTYFAKTKRGVLPREIESGFPAGAAPFFNANRFKLEKRTF
jgi:hypothetical protein